MMTASVLHSQGADTSKMWINRQDALWKLGQADSLPGVKAILEQKERDVDSLSARINDLKLSIATLRQKDTNNGRIIQEQENQKTILEDQKKIALDEIATLKKDLKKSKRKTFWTSMGGVAGIVAALFLGLRL